MNNLRIRCATIQAHSARRRTIAPAICALLWLRAARSLSQICLQFTWLGAASGTPSESLGYAPRSSSCDFFFSSVEYSLQKSGRAWDAVGGSERSWGALGRLDGGGGFGFLRVCLGRVGKIKIARFWG